jgi:hypothetical protein
MTRQYNCRTKSAQDARKYICKRFSLPENISFIEVAKKLIVEDNLYAEIPTTRDQAIAFLSTYGSMIDRKIEIRPLTRKIHLG